MIISRLCYLLLAAWLASASVVLGGPSECANNKSCGTSPGKKCESCENGQGSNPFYPNGGNVTRSIRDLEV